MTSCSSQRRPNPSRPPHPGLFPQQYLSYIPTDEGFLYLAALKDLATREIVGWARADHLKAGLCIDALVMALQRYRPPRGLIHHSDRGVQGEFKWSSQHGLFRMILGTHQAPRQVFSSPGSFAAWR
jgi:transposase InsO family protein